MEDNTFDQYSARCNPVATAFYQSMPQSPQQDSRINWSDALKTSASVNPHMFDDSATRTSDFGAGRIETINTFPHGLPSLNFQESPQYTLQHPIYEPSQLDSSSFMLPPCTSGWSSYVPTYPNSTSNNEDVLFIPHFSEISTIQDPTIPSLANTTRGLEGSTTFYPSLGSAHQLPPPDSSITGSWILDGTISAIQCDPVSEQKAKNSGVTRFPTTKGGTIIPPPPDDVNLPQQYLHPQQALFFQVPSFPAIKATSSRIDDTPLFNSSFDETQGYQAHPGVDVNQYQAHNGEMRISDQFNTNQVSADQTRQLFDSTNSLERNQRTRRRHRHRRHIGDSKCRHWCPFPDCNRSRARGGKVFLGTSDRDRHILTHAEPTIQCPFCSSTTPDARRHLFRRKDSLREYIISSYLTMSMMLILNSQSCQKKAPRQTLRSKTAGHYEKRGEDSQTS